jgi:hypothetical protein
MGFLGSQTVQISAIGLFISCCAMCISAFAVVGKCYTAAKDGSVLCMQGSGIDALWKINGGLSFQV